MGERECVSGRYPLTHSDSIKYLPTHLCGEKLKTPTEKRVKYLHLVANAVIQMNAVDISNAIQSLAAQGHSVNREMIRTLSPYMTGHIKRYGDYVVDRESDSSTVGDGN